MFEIASKLLCESATTTDLKYCRISLTETFRDNLHETKLMQIYCSSYIYIQYLLLKLFCKFKQTLIS